MNVPPTVGPPHHWPGQTEGVTTYNAVEMDAISPAPAAYTYQGTAVKAAYIPGVTPLHLLGNADPRMRLYIDCPFCQQRTQTKTKKKGKDKNLWIKLASFALCLCCLGLPLFCDEGDEETLASCCPPCLPSCSVERSTSKNTEYMCTNCNQKVATVSEEGHTWVCGPVLQVPSQYATA